MGENFILDSDFPLTEINIITNIKTKSMKTKILALAMTLAMVFSFGNTYADKHEKKTVVFNVDMHCSSCKAKVEKNLPFEKGVRDLKVDMKTKTVKIVYRADKNTETNLIKAIQKCGVKVIGKVGEHNHAKCDHKHCNNKNHGSKCTGDCGTCKTEHTACTKAGDHKHAKCDHKEVKIEKHEGSKCTGDCNSCKTKTCKTENTHTCDGSKTKK